MIGAVSLRSSLLGLLVAITAALPVWGCGEDPGGTGGAATGAGAGGMGGSGGSTGSGDACEEPGESFAFEIALSDGTIHDCAKFQDEEIALQGAIVSAVGPTAWEIDSCAPGAGCAPAFNTLTVLTTGLDLQIPAGTYVEIAAKITHIGGVCTAGLLVSNLPTWNGSPNPTEGGTAPWLDSGGPGSPFSRDTVFRCATGFGANDCPGGQEFYALTFLLAADPSAVTEPVDSGQSIVWDVAAGPAAGRYTARTLHAHSGYCEQPGSIEYFIARAP